MRAVAEWRICRVFTLAPPNGLLLRDFVFDGLEPGPLVRTIAKGRMSGAATGTPPMGPSLHFESEGLGVTDDGRFSHENQRVGESATAFLSAIISGLLRFSIGVAVADFRSSFGYR